MPHSRGIFSLTPFLLLTSCWTSHPSSLPSAYPPLSEPEVRAVELFKPQFRGEGLFRHLRLETEGTVGEDYDVDVSPNGKQLVFSSTRQNPAAKIMAKKMSGGGLIQKTHGPQRDIQPKYSPDGKWIAFASDREGNFDILIISSERNEAYWQLTSSPGDELHPSWSPDGKRLAYCARSDDGGWSLWIIELEGQKRTQLGSGLYPEWSPDGKYLAFQRPSLRGKGWFGIWIVNVEGGPPRQIACDENWGSIQPAWSANSRRIVYSTARSPVTGPGISPVAEDLWVVDLVGGPPYRLTNNRAEDFAPCWGLDGRVYFTSTRGGSARIWSAEPVREPNAFGSDSNLLPRGMQR